MRVAVEIFSSILILVILWEAFETIILPRRVSRRFRLTRAFYIVSWKPWAWVAKSISNRKRRDSFLGYFGPLSLLFLLVFWGIGLMIGYGLLQWSVSSLLNTQDGHATGFWVDLYMSGTTFFTLGLGDVVPRTGVSRLLTVLECGTGFGFLAALIGYLPTIYQAFSRREANISLLDARAGSPPTAMEILRRDKESGDVTTLTQLLADWERWSADILESHLSYPALCYYRSQHDNQSWLAALTAVLDVCALVIVGVERVPAWQARLTFAMARHAMVDIAQVFRRSPKPPAEDRLPPAKLAELREALAADGVTVCGSPTLDARLTELRGLYEPYVAALGEFLLMDLPDWMPKPDAKDSWKTAAGKHQH